MKACRNFQQFQGKTEKELLAWLRSILINALRSAVEHEFKAGKRDLRREVSLHDAIADLANSVNQLDQALFVRHPHRAIRRLDANWLLSWPTRLLRCPPIIAMCSSCEIWKALLLRKLPKRMNRSVGAVRILWLRAVAACKKMLPRKNEHE